MFIYNAVLPHQNRQTCHDNSRNIPALVPSEQACASWALAACGELDDADLWCLLHPHEERRESLVLCASQHAAVDWHRH